MSETERRPKAVSQKTRNFARYPLDVRVVVHVFRSGGISSFWGRSTEVGEDGIGATLTGDLEPGEVVSMEFSLGLTAYPLKLRAVVRHRRGLHYGFEFLTVTQAQRTAIQRVCQLLASGASSGSGRE